MNGLSWIYMYNPLNILNSALSRTCPWSTGCLQCIVKPRSTKYYIALFYREQPQGAQCSQAWLSASITALTSFVFSSIAVSADTGFALWQLSPLEQWARPGWAQLTALESGSQARTQPEAQGRSGGACSPCCAKSCSSRTAECFKCASLKDNQNLKSLGLSTWLTHDPFLEQP